MRKVVRVEPLHLDEKGYGASGDMTRRAWREICLRMLTSDAQTWKSWTQEMRSYLAPYRPAKYDYKVVFDTQEEEIYEACELHKDATSVSLDFVGCIFDTKQASFFRDFKLPALFCGAVFKGGLSTLPATEFSYVSFRFTQILGSLSIPEANFQSHANFSQMDIAEAANFEGSTFKGNVNFVKTRFRGSAGFGGLVVVGGAQFEYTQFFKLVGFGSADFQAYCHFQNSTFKGSGWFEGVSFKRGGHFEHSTFHKVPTFIGVKLETLLIFRGAIFKMPIAADNAEVWGFASDRFTALKHLSESCGQIEQVLRFNGYDLHTRYRNPYTTKALRYACGLYELSSDYGRSFIRPLCAYLSLLICTWFFAFNSGLYLAGSTYLTPSETLEPKPDCEERDNCAFPLSAYRAATEYTLYRAVGVLDFSDNDKKTADVNERLFGQHYEPALMRLWGIFKAIMSTALLFLTALGLRNRFRLK